MLQLMNIENLDIKVGDVADELLKFFVQYPKCSTYQTHKYLKELYKRDKRTISYKNVHKRIQKLHNFELIKEDRKNNDLATTKHGAIYYSITSFGIFYILKNRLVLNNKNLITEHRYDSLYENFLYPYIQFNTINQIYDIQIIIRICGYLAKCCDELFETVNSLKEIQNAGGQYNYVTGTRDLLNQQNKKYSTEFIKYLKQRCNLKWLDDKKFQLHAIENDLNFVIQSGKRILNLKLYPDDKKAVLSNDDTVFEFYLERDETDIDNYKIYQLISRNLYDYIDEFVNYIDTDFPINNQHKLCFEIIEYFNYLFFYHHLTHEQKEGNKKIIRRDKNFLTLLNQFKDQFDSYYNNFIKIE